MEFSELRDFNNNPWCRSVEGVFLCSLRVAFSYAYAALSMRAVKRVTDSPFVKNTDARRVGLSMQPHLRGEYFTTEIFCFYLHIKWVPKPLKGRMVWNFELGSYNIFSNIPTRSKCYLMALYNDVRSTSVSNNCTAL
jgi:hypothetical protein